ncbi:ABC transporter permease, partial [Streptomyces europaeiscabiei]|nr:ABC transporter permease [Streptomyces europaeiscabiei]
MSRVDTSGERAPGAGTSGGGATPEEAASEAASPTVATRTPSLLWTFGLFRSELVTTFRRWRTIALLGVLAAVPVLVGIAVRIETGGG